MTVRNGDALLVENRMQRGEFDLKSLAIKGESELSDEVVRLFSGHGIPRLCEGGWYLSKVDIVTTPKHMQ